MRGHHQLAHRAAGKTDGGYRRVLVSLGVVLVLNLIFLMGRHITIKVMGFLVFPLMPISCLSRST
jgi:amino acid permease